MVQQRTEFPELEAIRDDLDRQRHEAQKQINDGIYNGKPDAAAEQWRARVSKAIEELNYVLDFFLTIRFRQSQAWQWWQTAAIFIVILLSLILSIFAVWRG